MPAAVGPRFVLEAGFLVLLAVVVGLADLEPAMIVLVMTVGWLLVSLIEYFAWRQTQGLAMSRYEAAAPVPAEQERVTDDVAPPPAPPPPPPPPQPTEEETVVQAPAPEEKETVSQADDRVAKARASFTAEERRLRHRLEPLQPRPRRRWIFFGPHERRPEPQPPAEGDREEER